MSRSDVPKYWYYPSGCPYCGNDRVRYMEGRILKGALLDITFIGRKFSSRYKQSRVECCNCGKVLKWIPTK